MVFHIFGALAEFERALIRASGPGPVWWPHGHVVASTLYAYVEEPATE